MDYRERRSHTRGVYPAQYTLRMRTAEVKQEVRLIILIDSEIALKEDLLTPGLEAVSIMAYESE